MAKKKAPQNTQFFMSNEQRAAAFVAFKELERIVGRNGLDPMLPPGFIADVGGVEVSVKIPEGTSIEAVLGADGKGHNYKRATQDLYGWVVWTLFLKKLAKFNQAKLVKEMLLEAMREACSNPNTSVGKELKDVDPELAAEVEKLQAEFPLPDRIENAPRRIARPDDEPLPTVQIRKKAA